MGSTDNKWLIYYRSRIKRMITTNGYNVYPNYIEELDIEYVDGLPMTLVGKVSYKDLH